MKFPEELNFLLQQFHADCFDFGRSEVEVVQHALGALIADEKRAVKAFLSQLLSRPTDVNDLQRQWFASQADIRFGDANEIPIFLKMVHDQIE